MSEDSDLTEAGMQVNSMLLLKQRFDKSVETTFSETDEDGFSPSANRDFESGLAESYVRAPSKHDYDSAEDYGFGRLAKFDGVVTEREGGSFWVRLFETPKSFPNPEVEFDLEDLTESDRLLAVAGAPIVWTIGYSDKRGTRKKESILYVRRLQPASEEEIQNAKADLIGATCAITWE